MTNVLFSFVMGLIILTFGMYGRVSSKLPHDNPYWRRRHAREAARESLAIRRRGQEEKPALSTGGASGSPVLPAANTQRER